MKTTSLFLIVLAGLMTFCSPADDPTPTPTYDGITSIEGVPSPNVGLNYYRLNQFDYDGVNEIHKAFVVQYKSSNARVLGNFGITYDFDESTIESLEESCWFFSHNEFIIDDHKEGKALKVKATGDFVTEMFNFLLADEISFTLKKEDRADNITVNLYLQTAINKTLLSSTVVSDNGTDNITVTLDQDYSTAFLIVEIVYTGDANSYLIIDDLVIDSSNSAFTINNQCQNDLPITLLWQKATIVDLGILIEYETATELNSDYVQVEWSTDAVNWTTIGYVPSNNQPSTYSFLHK